MATPIYSVNAKGKVTMKTKARAKFTDAVLESLDTLDLSTFELKDGKYLVKQVDTCPVTNEPVLVILEIKISNSLPAKKSSAPVEEYEIPALDL